MSSGKHYVRVRISGVLITESALHIGTGELSEKNAINSSYNILCRDTDGKPYMPASSLRGFLRTQAQILPECLFEQWFGYTEQDLKEKQQLDKTKFKNFAGKLRVYDARLRNLKDTPTTVTLPDLPLRTHVRIEPRLGVALEHALFSIEYVPKGSTFDACFEVEQVCEQDLPYALGLLETWDGSVHSAVGGGSGKGLGRLQWGIKKIEVLSEPKMQAWLKDGCKPLPYEVVEIPDAQTLSRSSLYSSVELRLQPQSPFLINDPMYVDKNDENKPDLEFSRTPDGRALVPGSSLRGWVRGQARRIVLTLLTSQYENTTKDFSDLAEKCVAQIFGNTKQRGKLQFDDMVSSRASQAKLQTFNAVDRFTGGVAEGKLYTVNAAEALALCGCIRIAKDLATWEKGLLLLVLRDALEGDLLLGWGKSRGYGQFQLRLTYNGQMIDTWETLWGMLDEDDAKGWIIALHEWLQVPLPK